MYNYETFIFNVFDSVFTFISIVFKFVPYFQEKKTFLVLLTPTKTFELLLENFVTSSDSDRFEDLFGYPLEGNRQQNVHHLISKFTKMLQLERASPLSPFAIYDIVSNLRQSLSIPWRVTCTNRPPLNS